MNLFFLHKNDRIRISAALLIAAFGYGVQAQSAHQSLRKGDRQYDLEKYKEAEKHYRTAADLNFSDPKSLYNLGNALYQQGRWEDAAERFELAAKYSAGKPELADALHNLGNALLKQRKYQDAVDAYENSLRFRPGDAETKMNLQMAKKKLQQEKQDQQNQQNQQNQDQQNNQGNGQQNPPPQNQPPQNQQQPNQQPQDKPGDQPQNQGQKPPPQSSEQLKKEEAKRLLETAVGPEDQRNAQKYRAAQQQSKPKVNKKDW